MRNKYLGLIKCVIGLAVAFIAVSNCFNVLSNSSKLASLPSDDARPSMTARPHQYDHSTGLPGSTDTGLVSGDRGTAIGARVDLATRASAISPFAPNITATKSHTPSGDAHPGDTLTYTIVITNSGTTDATGVNFSDTIDPNTTLVPGSVKASPIAVDDSYHTIGNVNISVPIGQGVIANDLNPNGAGTLTVTKVNSTPVPGGGSATDATANGSVTMNSDGSFSYTPNVAFRGPSDSFTYTLDNGTGSTDAATVTVSVNGLIWFVDAGAASGGDGRLSSPFNCLVAPGCFYPGAADIANDNIFVYSGSYTGGLTLLSGQKLIGQGASQPLLTITGLSAPSGNNLLPATGGSNPAIASAADGVDLGSNNQIWGVTFGSSPGPGISGSAFGTLTVRDTTINNASGPALSLTTSGTLDAVFQSLSSTNSATTGINLNTVGGSLSSPTTTVTNPAGRGIDVESAPAGASLSFGDATVNQSGNIAVFLTGNTGNVSFGALNIAPDANVRALQATENGGSITTTSGAITTSNAVAVEITRSSGTTPLVISLTSVSSSGSQGGVVLTNTSGSFTVVGDGANARNGTGGTITGSGATGNGITLNNVQNLSLSRMNINSHGDYGVKGQSVNGFVLDWCSFTGNGNTNAGLGEGAVLLADTAGLVNGLIGTGPLGTSPTRISNNAMTSSAANHIRISNISGTLTQLDVTKNTLTGLGSSPPPGQGGGGLQMQLSGNAIAKVVVTGNGFSDNSSNGLQGSALGQSNLTVNVLGATANGANTFTNNNAGILLSNKNDAQLTTEISSNTFLGQPDNAIFVGNATPPVSSLSNISAKILSNVITQPVTGINHVVLAFFSGTGAPSAVQVCNNNIVNNGQLDGIHLNTPDGGTSPNFSATVNNNTVINAASAANAINLNGRQSSVACFHVQDNTTTAPSGIGIQVRRANSATVSLEKGVSSSTSASTVLSDNNPLATGSTPTFVSGTVTVVNNGTCSTPGSCSSPSISSLGPVISSATAQPALQNYAPGETPVSDLANTLRVFEGERPNGKEAARISPAELNWIVQAAIERWRLAGIATEDLGRLKTSRFDIGDLADRKLATMSSEGIRIDATAAGFGWFFDQTPSDDQEFVVPVFDRELQTTDSSAAFGQIDLLTVVMRELGLVYLQGKDRIPNRMRPLMQGDLPAGVRRLPMLKNTDRLTSHAGVSEVVHDGTQALTALRPKTDSSPSVLTLKPAVFNTSADLMPGIYGRNAKRMSYAASARRVAALRPFSGETVNLSVGTIPASESVTIMFQVTIDNPFPNGVCTVTNQGHVAGTNFSPVDTNSDVTPVNKTLTIGSCPANITTNTDAGVCTAVVTYTAPTADGCPVPTVNCTPASGSAFAKGATTVTCTASNGASPDQSCNFTVTVNDTEPPTVTCPSPITANTDPGQCAAVVTYTTPAGHDNCPGVTVNCSPGSGSTFNKGVTTVTCTATDAAGLTGNCTFTITVVDNQAPTIGACPSPVITNTAPGTCSAVVTYATPGASDNCPGVTVGCSPPSGSVFLKGTTPVTCTATDTSGHTASCSFNVTVVDNQAPSITCPGNVNTTEDSPGSGCATVTYTTPTPSDNCPGATANCTPASGTCFAIGTTTVTCTATDTSFNTSSCQFTVTVTAIGLTSLSPAKVWIGLKNSDDVGTKFDLLAEVLRNGSVVGSGQLNDVPGGSSGFNNAVLRTITLALSSAVPMGPGDTMSFRLSVRIGATSGHNTGTARLWYNGAAIDSGASRDAGSRFDATIAGSTSDYFLRSPGFTLNTTAGSSRVSVDKTVSNSGGNPFVPFGTWSKTF